MTATHEHLPVWNDAQIKRFVFRHGLFQRRGVEFFAAEKLAESLVLRDYERDDRRICLECDGWQRGGKCFHVTQGTMPNVSPRHEPVMNVLQRCDFFKFSTP
ncbi:hypothetical protein [Rhodoferax ferrireducens]|uniref:hypothetical protein n=1 Tax=Rhodoferax ferrireducens TaxID=192843 RepID=UPI000E0CD85E|nr:hypothetical protein [Rhodoferax ferrireducens]